MSTVNKCFIIGRLGQDPHVTYVGTRKKAEFSVATNHVYKNQQGDKVTHTDWHKVVVWGKTADFVENYLMKGTQVSIDGRYTMNKYQKQGTNEWVNDPYITPNQYSGILLLDKVKQQDNSSNLQQPVSTVEDAVIIPEDDSDDLPF